MQVAKLCGQPRIATNTKSQKDQQNRSDFPRSAISSRLNRILAAKSSAWQVDVPFRLRRLSTYAQRAGVEKKQSILGRSVFCPAKRFVLLLSADAPAARS